MFRKKLLLASLVSASMIPAIAQADTKNFEGLSAGLNLNLIHAGIKLTEDGDTLDGLGGKEAASVALDVAYGFKLGNSSVLTLGIDVDFSKPKIASLNDFSVKQKSRYGIYLAPGTAINKDTLFYGRLGYNKLEGELEIDGTSAKQKFNGVSYGVGIKTMISKSTFVKVEANRLTYSSKTLEGVGFEPSATVGTVGIGMNF
jgi:hypothetical protein